MAQLTVKEITALEIKAFSNPRLQEALWKYTVFNDKIYCTCCGEYGLLKNIDPDLGSMFFEIGYNKGITSAPIFEQGKSILRLPSLTQLRKLILAEGVETCLSGFNKEKNGNIIYSCIFMLKNDAQVYAKYGNSEILARKAALDWIWDNKEGEVKTKQLIHHLRALEGKCNMTEEHVYVDGNKAITDVSYSQTNDCIMIRTKPVNPKEPTDE